LPSKPSRESRRFPRRQQILLILADAGLAEAFYLLSLTMARSVGMRAGLPDPTSGSLPLVLAVVFPLIVASRGLYRLGRFPSWRGQATAGLRAVAWSVAVSVGGLFLFAREIPFAVRLLLVSYHGLLAAWMVALRPLLAVLLRKRHEARANAPERILFVGSDRTTAEMALRLVRHNHGVEVLGFADHERPGGRGVEPFYPSALDELPELAAGLGADLVVLARPGLPREDVVRLTDRLVGAGIHVRVASNALNRLVDGLPTESFGGVPLVPVGQTPLTGLGERVKRAFDICAAAVGGLAILPLLLLLTLLVRLSSPGPILYRQIRIGRHGRPFVFYKFRSMRAANDDAEHRRFVEDLVAGSGGAIEVGGRKVYKLIDDPRVTPVGSFLRRTSLDELPQLINVLRGEMSLVGPRPCLPFEYELYKEWQKRRLSVTPGMTGLWQVTGRSYVTFEDMVLLDLFYMANWSFGMDLKLLIKTIPVVIFGKGGI
jgi:exopolysaccharide biosynthesis polyprenyl glycosylphosphotransferase